MSTEAMMKWSKPELIRRIAVLEKKISDSALSSDMVLAKRPVAWRVKDFADGWIVFQDEEAANREVEQTGAVMQGLYVRDGTPLSSDMVMAPREPTGWIPPDEQEKLWNYAFDYAVDSWAIGERLRRIAHEQPNAAALRQREGGGG